MATYYSDYQLKLRASGALATRADKGPVNMTRKTARFEYTPLATEVNTEWAVLGQLGAPNARVIPEACRIRFTGTGTIDFKVTLKKMLAATAATQTALTATSATIAALTATISLAAVAGANDTIPLLVDDWIVAVWGTGATAVTLPVTAKIIFEIAYDVPQ